MPALTLSTIRKPYSYHGYLTVVSEAVVLEGTLTATPSYPALTLAYTLTAGDEGDVLADMEVELYTSANAFKGRLRVAKGGTITSTSLPVNEFSRGRLDIISGDKFKVLRSWRIRDRLVAANATFDKDSRIVYTDQNEHIAPVACAGGPWAGFVDAGQSYATLELSAAESFTLDPDSGGDLNFLWDVGDGTITVGSDTDETLTVRFPTGSRWVQLTVEDDDNGATSVYYFPVEVHNYTNARPHEVIMSAMDGERLSGWRCTFQLPAGADIEDLPDGALVIYHEDEYYGGVKGSYGNPVANRSRVKFSGYVTADTITVDAYTNEVSFEAVGAQGILEQLPGFSQVLKNVSNPANWQEYEDLTVFQTLIYLIREGTTAANVCDIILRGTDVTYPALYIQKAVPAQQVRELADGMSWDWTSDRNGRLMFSRKLVRMDSTDRDAATSIATLTADDRYRITARREHRSPINTLYARGFSAGASPAAMWSKAPGDAPDEGAGETTIERLIESDQDTLNALAGWAYAEETKRLNGIPSPNIDIELPGGYDCIDFYPEWLKLTLDATRNKRGLGLTAQRGIVEYISVLRDAARGEKRVSINWQCETDGAEGIKETIPIGDGAYVDVTLPDLYPLPGDPLLLPIVPPEYASPPTVILAMSPASPPELALVATDGSETPISHSMTGYGMDFCQDPWNFSRIFMLTSDGLWTAPTADGTYASVADNATIFGDAGRIGHKIIMSPNKQGWIAIACGTNVVAVSFNYGVSWTTVAVDGGAEGWGTSASPAQTSLDIGISSHNSSTVGWVYAATGTTTVSVHKSTNYGSSWATVGSNSGMGRTGRIHIPHKRIGGANNINDSSQLLYLQSAGGPSDNGRTLFSVSVNAGVSWTDKVYSGGGAGNMWFMGAPAMYPLTAYTDDGGYVFSVGSINGGGANDLNVSRSEDGFDTYVLNTHSTDGFRRLVNIVGWPYERDWALLFSPGIDTYRTTNGFLKYTDDGGATLHTITPASFTDGFCVKAEFLLAAL